MNILLSGGGTGGHIYPALAIGKLIKNKYDNVNLIYVGTPNGLEASIVSKEGIKFIPVTVEGLPRKISYKLIKAVFKLIKGSFQSNKIIKKYTPDVVIATGGYVCGPISYFAAKRGIKLVLHEQNAIPGLTNRILAGKADLICTTFEESLKYFKNNKKVEITGLPIRQSIYNSTRNEGARALGLNPSKFIILVTGGSRGAKKLNNSMLKVYETFYNNSDIHIIHITGNTGYKEFIAKIEENLNYIKKGGNITIKPYLHEMHNALACADLVVGRAGATFISEITAKGIPAILIPYPYAAENHQEANALSLVKNNAAVMIKDGELTGNKLSNKVFELVNNKNTLIEMKRNSKKLGKFDAGEKIVSLIERLLQIK